MTWSAQPYISELCTHKQPPPVKPVQKNDVLWINISHLALCDKISKTGVCFGSCLLSGLSKEALTPFHLRSYQVRRLLPSQHLREEPSLVFIWWTPTRFKQALFLGILYLWSQGDREQDFLWGLCWTGTRAFKGLSASSVSLPLHLYSWASLWPRSIFLSDAFICFSST